MKRAFIGGLVLAMIATACGGGSGSDSVGGSDAHNDKDIAFAQEMIVHHEQAVVMAQIAQDQTSSDEIRDLAARIEDAQTPEIESMQGWLEEWGASESPDGMGGMDHGNAGGEMAGMMSDEEMSELASARSSELDAMFLTMMIEHHEGAVSMAEEEIENGEWSEAVDLAESIKSTQEAEIEEMRALLQDLD